MATEMQINVKVEAKEMCHHPSLIPGTRYSVFSDNKLPSICQNCRESCHIVNTILCMQFYTVIAKSPSATQGD